MCNASLMCVPLSSVYCPVCVNLGNHGYNGLFGQFFKVDKSAMKRITKSLIPFHDASDTPYYEYTKCFNSRRSGRTSKLL